MSAVQRPHAEQFSSREQQTFAGTFGMWVFIASELLFFGPLLFGYLYLRVHYPQACAAASRHTDFLLGTANTAVLLTSSFVMALAGHAAEADRRRHAARLLVGVAVLGIAFLVIKGAEYHAEFQEHLFPGWGFRPERGGHPQDLPGMQLFFLLYFALTGLHALHLTIGIAVCLALAYGLRRPLPSGPSGEAVEYAGLYWHFVDLVWIFLYPLLYLIGRAGS
ncbi:cytochrome c oxidase subunit 3 family protein [Massilia sp. LXY-6]|uniref:cytochrome c oxidase subunit 3 family protein n=1 Tax=Massilia sp. LXY-6 TaxID=3379823 RepID=UPI003EE26781